MLGGHCCLSRQTARADERAPRGGLRGSLEDRDWSRARQRCGGTRPRRVRRRGRRSAGATGMRQGGQGLGRRRRGLQKLMSEIVDGLPLMGRPRRDRRGEPAIRVAARAGDPSRCPHRRSESLPAPAIRVAARAGDPSRRLRCLLSLFASPRDRIGPFMAFARYPSRVALAPSCRPMPPITHLGRPPYITASIPHTRFDRLHDPCRDL